MKSKGLTTWVVALATASFFTLAVTAVQAQTAPAAAADQELTEITVTGSRVITNGNDAPTPVTVIMPEQVLATKPSTIYENLIDMPVFSGSRGAANSAVGNGPTGQNAVSTLNLRNMGAQRSLVLFDGHRVPPSTPDGLVDVSSLPQMLLQRVDVVTGGASAVYGSDAITGVTNFITDSKFNGLKVNLQRGVSAHNDDKSYQVGIAFGHDIGARGHFEASYQRNKDDGLYDDQRRWADPRWTVLGNGGTIPWHLVSYATNASASFGGAIACPTLPPISPSCPPANIGGQTVFPLVGQTFNQNGVLSPFDPGLRGAANGLGSPATQIGGDGVIFDNVALKSAVRTDQVFARFDYDLTDSVHAYVAGSGNASYVAGNTGVQRTFPPGWRLGACNAYLTAAQQTGLGCTPTNNGTASEPLFFFEKAFDPKTNYGYGQNNRLFTHDYFVMADLAGKFGEGYKWDATYTHSESIMDIRAVNQNYTHQYAGLDAVKDPATGNIVCKVTLTNPGLVPGCIPLDMFGPTAMTADMVNYLADVISNRTQNKLDGFSGSLTGAPLNSWAGPIDMAVSAELRKLTMDLSTTSLPTDFINCTGMRFGNCVQGVTLLHNNSWLPVSGANQRVSEAAYEFNLPLMKDTSLAKNLSFNGAARYTKYKDDPNDPTIVSRSFSAVSWKAGLVWDLSDQLTLRWARSRDIRAPTLYDLYLPQTVGNKTFAFDYLLIDPVTKQPGVQFSATPISGGNPYLDPEVAHTSTLGIIYRPTSQLSLSLDAYRIDLLKVLYSLNGASQTVQQACYDSGGASPVCQLQSRPNGCCSDASLANQVTIFYTRLVNIAEQKTSGIDFEANFNTRMFERALSLRALVTYQPHILYYLPLAPVVYDTAGVAYPGIGGNPAPVWKGVLYAAYKVTDNLAINVSERYRSRLGFTEDPRQTQIGGVGSMAYTNLTLDYRLPIHATQANVFLNVQNLFDKAPPPASPQNGTFPGSTPGVYAIGDDVVGAYYTLGVRLKM